MDTSKQPGLQIAQVMLLSAQFAHREDALSLVPATPIVEMPVNIEISIGAEGPEAEAVALRLRAFTPADRPDLLYKFDIHIAVIIGAVPGEENLKPFDYAQQMGAAAFFPFLREYVANITGRGRFGAVMLKPTNFLAFTQLPAPAEAAKV
jgi:preprotein translocase subunit SecB